jgi:enamine deaminase RidA (YjgF/YER057c/UK114 family)
MVCISGKIAFDKERKLLSGDDMKAQAEQGFKNVAAALAAAGARSSTDA